MIKVPLALAVMALMESGELDEHARRPVHAANATANDLPSPIVPGYPALPGELVRYMLTRSDNVATNELIDLAGRERATALAVRHGLQATSIRRKLSGSEPLIADPEATGRNAHPASDAAALFAAIARRAVPRAAELEALLLEQEWNDKLSGGLLPGDRFAHKTGETGEVSHDGGLLYTAAGSVWVVVVYTTLPAGPEADARHGAFMRSIRPLLG
jgi:beta-lactamase class A